MEKEQLDPGEIVEQFNVEIAEKQEQLYETVILVEKRLEEGLNPENVIEDMHEEYRELSKKDITFMPESDDFRPTEPVKPLKQPKRKDYDGSRGLAAIEPELLEHKQELDRRRDMTLKQAQQAYSRFREEKGLEPVEEVADIPSELDELEKLKEAKRRDIYAVRDYLRDLKEVKTEDKTVEETEYSVPENKEFIEGQIEKASRRIYKSWEEIKNREERLEDAVNQLKAEEGERPAIYLSLKYGIRPFEDFIDEREQDIQQISGRWNKLGGSVKQELPEEYSQRIDVKQEANV